MPRCAGTAKDDPDTSRVSLRLTKQSKIFCSANDQRRSKRDGRGHDLHAQIAYSDFAIRLARLDKRHNTLLAGKNNQAVGQKR